MPRRKVMRNMLLTGNLGSPYISASTLYYGNAGNGATLINLCDAAITVDGWFKLNAGTGTRILILKGALGVTGWDISRWTDGFLIGRVICATTSSTAQAGTSTDDGLWHYYKMTFDDAGDRKSRIYVDNILVGTGVAAVGAIVSDAATNCFIGAVAATGGNSLGGCHGWIRISNIVRATEATSRFVPPVIDANTVAQWNVTERIGATLNDTSGNANHGTMAGTYTWMKG